MTIIKAKLNRVKKIIYSNNRLEFYSFTNTSNHEKVDNNFGNGLELTLINTVEGLKRFEKDPKYERVKKEIAKGASAYLVFKNEQIKHHSFVSRIDTYVGEINKCIVLDEKLFYIYNCFTEPDVRGNKIFLKVLNKIISSYLEESYFVIASLDWNVKSIRVIKQCRFIPAGSCHYISILGFENFINDTGFAFKQ